MNILQQLSHAYTKFLTQTFPDAFRVVNEKNTHSTIELTLNADTTREAFGDLSSNAALIIAKELKKSPRDVASTIIEQFKDSRIERIEIAGPGFINIYLKSETFVQLAHELCTAGADWFKLNKDEIRKSYSVEFVSANPTGPLHIGHGRNGIIGDVLSRILRFLGHSVTTEFYINDAGSQIEKLGNSLKIRCQQALGESIALPEDGYHGEYLIELAKECIDAYGPEVTQESVLFFGNFAKKILLDRIRDTLQLYRITFDVWFSETTLHANGEIEKSLTILAERGHTYEQDGALWLRATSFGDDKDRVIRKQSGEYTYLAADIAYLANKIARGFDNFIIVLGQDHHSYLTRLKAVMAAFGQDPDRLDIILYQLVTLKNEGELLRLSKRAGRIVGLRDIIETIGPDVARFFYLNRKADAHLEFDIALALKRTEENPVYYIQYAFVRTKSIFEKAAQIAELHDITSNDAQNLTVAEQLILKKIASLQSILRYIAKSHQMHMLSYYTLELAHLFHNYYAHHRIIAKENIIESRGRLLMVKLVQQTLVICLDLLGLKAPESM